MFFYEGMGFLGFVKGEFLKLFDLKGGVEFVLWLPFVERSDFVEFSAVPDPAVGETERSLWRQATCYLLWGEGADKIKAPGTDNSLY